VCEGRTHMWFYMEVVCACGGCMQHVEVANVCGGRTHVEVAGTSVRHH
jgi:hypothetical protein